MDARRVPEFVGVDEIGVVGQEIDLGDQLLKPRVLLDDIVGKKGDADAALHRMLDGDEVVDPQGRQARVVVGPADAFEPVHVAQVVGRGDAEGDDPVLVDVLDGLRAAEALDVGRRGEQVEVHREQLALDQVGLGRLAQADGDVGLSHGEVELVVVEDELQLDVGVEVDELVDARGQPGGADADGGGDAQRAGRALAAVGQPALHVLELQEHVMGGAVEQFALLGEDQAAGVAVEQRHAEILLEGADLAADGGLAHVQAVAGVGEAPGVGGGVEYPELVPIHRVPLCRPHRCRRPRTGHRLLSSGRRQSTGPALPLVCSAASSDPKSSTPFRPDDSLLSVSSADPKSLATFRADVCLLSVASADPKSLATFRADDRLYLATSAYPKNMKTFRNRRFRFDASPFRRKP
ncbi:hypothetical protein KL86PLE_90306 [uncultured Pleomorphomonas sp.]|uniref:Uncharacterized protein n=1 Tax=uncultured Pleomorphomonas sp. TaxID=442121 RepID=A0A212LP38_9HYPH|nr:hypothetical protein KL86PLE_90306 [uncultured Pleomorphomonas sp.]